jgi:hypothetical protein
VPDAVKIRFVIDGDGCEIDNSDLADVADLREPVMILCGDDQAVKCSHISHNFERLLYFPTFLQKPPIFPIFTFYLTDIS